MLSLVRDLSSFLILLVPFTIYTVKVISTESCLHLAKFEYVLGKRFKGKPSIACDFSWNRSVDDFKQADVFISKRGMYSVRV